MKLNKELTYSVIYAHRFVAVFRWNETEQTWQWFLPGAGWEERRAFETEILIRSYAALPGISIKEDYCGWCPRTEKEKAAWTGRSISHGICCACHMKQSQEVKELLAEMHAHN